MRYPILASLLVTAAFSLAAGHEATAAVEAGPAAPPRTALSADSAVAERGATVAPRREPRYISLLIGVGNYQWAHEWRDLENLIGPANDVVRVQSSIDRWGFKSGSDVQRILVDEQASKEGIAEAFRWLASQATEPNDVVVIYYSGHGSWAPDSAIDNVRTLDERLSVPGDVTDEALVPWDARNAHDPLQLVLDDEIGHWLDQLGTGNVTMIVDACFSGTISRGSPDPTAASAPRGRGPRPPEFATLGGGGMGEGARALNHTLITAASAYEIAYEKTFQPGNVVAGIMTRHLTDALDGAGPTTRFDELMAQVRARVGQNQTPQLEGDGAARVFKVGEGVVVPERGYATVRSSRGSAVELNVGAIHGARPGATYAVYGPDETAFRAGRLAQLVIDSVGERTSTARFVGAPISLPAGARATMSQVPVGAVDLDRLTVYLNPSAGALRSDLATLSWVRLTDDPSSAVAEVREMGGAYQVLVRGHEIPPLAADLQAGFAREATVAVEGKQVGIRGYEGSLDAVCGALRRGFSVAAMELVRNDAPPPQLRVDVRVLPTSVTTPRLTDTGVDTTYVGETYNIWAFVDVPPAAVPTTPLFLTAAVAGYTAQPTLLWPQAQVQPRLTPQQVNVPLLLFSNVRMSPVTGVEMIKAVINTSPFDLRPLISRLPTCGVRSGRGGWEQEPMVIEGWNSADRLVEIHPARS